IVVDELTLKPSGGGRPDLVSQADIERQLPVHLPLVACVEEVPGISSGWKDGIEIPTQLIGKIEKEGGKRVGHSIRTGRVAVQRSGTRSKGKQPSRIIGLGLVEIHAFAVD